MQDEDAGAADPATPLSLDEVRDAAATIRGEAIQTPVAASAALDDLTGATVLCKVEALQRAGAFKFRGAYNRLARIPATARPRGVVAVSSGNHGAAVACAARILGMAATIFIPEDAPTVKRRLIESFGATIETFDRSIADREAPALDHVARTGATFVHPFEDRQVMAGQGTAALELYDEVGAIDALVVPMSGGGLMAGCGSVIRALLPTCEIIGVEPELADDTRRSFARGEPVQIVSAPTIADGLAVLRPGATTFAINRRIVDDVVTVSEDAIVDAMRVIVDTLGVVVEPSGAVGIAAILGDRSRFEGRRVGVILSGGNIEPSRFQELTGRRPESRAAGSPTRP